MRIGPEQIEVGREYKRDLDVEILLRQVPIFGLVLLYAYGVISAAPFVGLFYLAYARYFICSHDRFHSGRAKRSGPVVELLADYVALNVIPWAEPYDSIRRKHMRHHYTHRPGKTPVRDARDDPHSAFEMGGTLRAFLGSMFYEEIQLFLDVRDGKLTQSRLVNALGYLPLQALFVVSFGWQVYLMVLLAVRLTGGLSWFVFSHVIHQPFVYHFGFARTVPAPLRWALGFSNGRRTMLGVLHHVVHHVWPAAPFDRLAELDAALLRHPESAPVMVPSGR